MEILITGGLGDLFSLDSMLWRYERKAIKTIHWATRATAAALPLFQRHYPAVEHVIHRTVGVYFNIQGVRRHHRIPDHVEDFSILKMFGEFLDRPFNRSTFLDNTVPIDHIKLPDRFVAIQHQTSDSGSNRALRDLDPEEWRILTERLERENLHGVVLNTATADPPPTHPRIINLVGKTTLLESISVLTRAKGFWGIASCLSVLACQLFPAEDLWIKGPESHFLHNVGIYCAPHRTFPFVVEHLGNPNRQQLDSFMQLIEFMKMRIYRNTLVAPGCVVEATPEEAEGHIRSGFARPYNPCVKPLDPPVEQLRQAVAPAPKARKRAVKFAKESP